MELALKTVTVDEKLAVPGAPMVTLRTDPAQEPGIVERVTDGEVTVFWTRSRRRWIYEPKQLKVLRRRPA